MEGESSPSGGPPAGAVVRVGAEGERTMVPHVGGAFLGVSRRKPLGSADRVDAEAFIASLGRSPRVEAWQIRHATYAVRILLSVVFGKSWLAGCRELMICPVL